MAENFAFLFNHSTVCSFPSTKEVMSVCAWINNDFQKIKNQLKVSISISALKSRIHSAYHRSMREKRARHRLKFNIVMEQNVLARQKFPFKPV